MGAIMVTLDGCKETLGCVALTYLIHKTFTGSFIILSLTNTRRITRKANRFHYLTFGHFSAKNKMFLTKSRKKFFNIQIGERDLLKKK